MLSAESIEPLDGLYSTLDASNLPSSSTFVPPVVCLSQTSAPKSSSNPKWTAALGVAQTNGSSTWYEKCYSLDEVERLVKVPGSTLTAQTTIKQLAKSWNSRSITITEFTKTGTALVQVTITNSLKISIELTKVSSTAIDHLRILQKTVPLALLSSDLTHSNQGLTQRAERAEKELGREASRRQDAETKLRNATQPSLKRSASSQSSVGRASYSQSPALYSGRQSPASPKKPKLKPGDSGYAGSSFRVGKKLDDPEGGFDEDPPSG